MPGPRDLLPGYAYELSCRALQRPRPAKIARGGSAAPWRKPGTMFLFRRLALLLALGLPALHAVQAQSSSSSSSSQTQGQDAAQQAPALSPSQESVQDRIRARRAQRRAAAIREIYSHLYESYIGAGYLRFTLPSPLQRVNEYDWDTGFTRYYNERLGVTLGARGYYGTPFIYNNESNLTKPAISQYAVLLGPSYRFLLEPRFSISGRVMGGWLLGDFSGDANGVPISITHLYPDGNTYGVDASLIFEYNLSPGLGIRVAPDYFGSGFGSTIENNLGFTAGLVYRFGKQ
jgi:hypothetical protein